MGGALWSGFPQVFPHRSDFVERLVMQSVTVDVKSQQQKILDDEISYKCTICDKVFGCASTLEAHERTHKAPRYECLDCGKGFSQLRNYKYHLSVHRGTKEFAAECPECGKTFNDKGYLSSHMKIHRNKKEYECPYCPKSFNQRVAFNMHVRIHTGVKPHKCTECGKRFSRKMLLKQHMRTHSGEKPYQCSVCGKSFADRSNMTLHHRLHSGIKPFTCPICPKAFTKKHHLKTHLNYHTGCKPYQYEDACEEMPVSADRGNNCYTNSDPIIINLKLVRKFSISRFLETQLRVPGAELEKQGLHGLA
ncbi:unnamed protein product [Hermetia illucens]|uniref:C2H2-type domain-containing protein n=1 Tax=Hermetia illucens TaxID=343691 RepID=A0A7R8YY01_HERIL|nr:unnamed protein product [Hermetia illucens]